MIKILIGLLSWAREIFLAVLIGSLAYMGISPDSQDGIAHKIAEFSEYGHIALTITIFSVFLASFLYVCFKHRKGIFRILRKLIDEARRIRK